jgi:hypothetical protein
MNILEALGQVTLYGAAWCAVSAGVALFIAAVFFGVKEKKSEKDQDDL